MSDNTSSPINIEIYQLDIYRLLTLLLADKAIAKDNKFNKLGDKFTEGEVNRLLTMIAVFSRQLLDDGKKSKGFEIEGCGIYQHPDAEDKKLTFRNACDKIIHAQEILLYKSPQKDLKREIKSDIKYFESIITIIGIDKKSKQVITELNFLNFADICIKMVNS